MRKVVSLTKGKEQFKHNDWLMFDAILESGAEVNIVRPEEPGDKLRIFKVVRNRGFRHQLAAFDKRNRVSNLRKGMQFFYMKK
ncbi:MAG: hypothetical protein JXR54_09885 [Tannerellaceae bacterium]|nr:hypothetical protein [Tannerellaceae bacterium]